MTLSIWNMVDVVVSKTIINFRDIKFQCDRKYAIVNDMVANRIDKILLVYWLSCSVWPEERQSAVRFRSYIRFLSLFDFQTFSGDGSEGKQQHIIMCKLFKVLVINSCVWRLITVFRWVTVMNFFSPLKNTQKVGHYF